MAQSDWTHNIKPVLGIQIWGTYTQNMQIWDEDQAVYNPVGNRLDMILRRTRFGIKYDSGDRLKATCIFAADHLGNDHLSGPIGSGNSGSFPNVGVWDIYLSYRLSNDEKAHLTFGYFPSRFSRESISSGFKITSLQKSTSQFYNRQFLTGRGPGRNLGLNLGGKFASSNFGFSYNLAIHNGPFIELSNTSTGNKSSPQIIGKLSFELGENISLAYQFSPVLNTLTREKKVEIGIYGTLGGTSSQYLNNNAVGVDWLLKYQGLQVEGEYTFFFRRGTNVVGNGNSEFTFQSNVKFIRATYPFLVNEREGFELSLTFMQFDGGIDIQDFHQAEIVKFFSGQDQTIDFGFNYYLLAQKVKLQLHYIFNNGDDGGHQSQANNLFFSHSGLSSIRRGDWLGAAVVFLL